MEQQSYSGRYFRTCWNDIKSSPGWFGKICLLGLISFIPVFGQMTVGGYAYEWAHKAAWGVEGPMPKKIYGRQGKMLRWGWFALVIAVVFMLVPAILSNIGGALTSAGAESGFYTSMGRYMVVSDGNVLLSILGWAVNVAALVAFVFATLLLWAGTIRMTMYDRLVTGFQFGKLWAMVKRDFGGIMRIFGMCMLFGIVGSLIITVVTVIIIVVVLGATAAPFLFMLSGNDFYYTDSAIVGYILTFVLALLPLLLVMGYISLVYNAFVELLVARAVGYWARQFDVARWGTKDDPLPFEADGAAAASAAQPAAPVSPQAASQQPATAGTQQAPASAAPAPAAGSAAQPAAPTGEPVIEASPQAPGSQDGSPQVASEEVIAVVADDAVIVEDEATQADDATVPEKPAE